MNRSGPVEEPDALLPLVPARNRGTLLRVVPTTPLPARVCHQELPHGVASASVVRWPAARVQISPGIVIEGSR